MRTAVASGRRAEAGRSVWGRLGDRRRPTVRALFDCCSGRTGVRMRRGAIAARTSRSCVGEAADATTRAICPFLSQAIHPCPSRATS